MNEITRWHSQSLLESSTWVLCAAWREGLLHQDTMEIAEWWMGEYLPWRKRWAGSEEPVTQLLLLLGTVTPISKWQGCFRCVRGIQNQGFSFTFNETSDNIYLIKVDGLCAKLVAGAIRKCPTALLSCRCRVRPVKKKQDPGPHPDSLSYLLHFSLKAQREAQSSCSGL